MAFSDDPEVFQRWRTWPNSLSCLSSRTIMVAMLIAHTRMQAIERKEQLACPSKNSRALTPTSTASRLPANSSMSVALCTTKKKNPVGGDCAPSAWLLRCLANRCRHGTRVIYLFSGVLVSLCLILLLQVPRWKKGATFAWLGNGVIHMITSD